MTQTPKDGGPAFPGFDPASETPKPLHGMSMRDWLAGQALAQLILAYTQVYGSPKAAPDKIATEAYRFADAMLAERERRQ